MEIEKKENEQPQPQGIMQKMNSSAWNILFMKRTNRLAIIMFISGIIYKLIEKLFWGA